MPFYAFGPLKITAVRNIESVASVEGPPIVIECPLGDSLRSVYPWFALCGLLLLRRATRTRAAWTLLLPPVALYVALVPQPFLAPYFVFSGSCCWPCSAPSTASASPTVWWPVRRESPSE